MLKKLNPKLKRLKQFFVVPSPPRTEYGRAYSAGADGGSSAPIFITKQAFASFPVMTAIISAVWGVLKKLSNVFDSAWTPVVLALLVGLVMLLMSVDDVTTKPKFRRDWIIAIVLALFNSLTLAAAALGLWTVA